MICSVFIVDDDTSARSSVLALIESAGLHGVTFSSAEALLAADTSAANLLLTDYRLPGINGLELVRRLAVENRRFPVIVITAFATEILREQARQLGVTDFLEKPYDPDHLLDTIRRACGAAGNK